MIRTKRSSKQRYNEGSQKDVFTYLHKTCWHAIKFRSFGEANKNIWPKDKISCIVHRMYFYLAPSFRVLKNVNMSSVQVTHDSREVSVSNEEKRKYRWRKQNRGIEGNQRQMIITCIFFFFFFAKMISWLLKIFCCIETQSHVLQHNVSYSVLSNAQRQSSCTNLWLYPFFFQVSFTSC